METSRPSFARLGLLGGMSLTGEDGPVRLRQSAQRVLAVLAVLHRHAPAGRSSIAERLWPDASAERAASNLRSTLWRMPRLRGRTLVVGSAAQVRLSDDLTVDLWEAEDQVRRLFDDPRPGPLDRRDLALLDLDLLPGWHEDWLLIEQESHRQRRLHALERCSHSLREHGRFNDALTAALGAVRGEPLRESAHRR